jgi:hypothetical protein
MKRPLNTTVAALTIDRMVIVNTLVRIGEYHSSRIKMGDRFNTTVAALTIDRMVIVITLVRVDRSPILIQ